MASQDRRNPIDNGLLSDEPGAPPMEGDVDSSSGSLGLDTRDEGAKRKRNRRVWFGVASAGFAFLILNLLCKLLEPWLLSICLTQGFHTAEKISLYINSEVAPDVIFMGSSRVPTGLNPAVAEEVLAQNNLKVRALNLGIVASGIDLNHRILKNVIRNGRKPKVIVYGLSEFDLFGLIPGNNKYDSISRVPYAAYLLSLNDFRERSGIGFEKKADFLLNQLLPVYRDQKLFQDAIKTHFRLDRKQVILRRPQADGYIPKPSWPFTPEQIAEADAGYQFVIPTYDMDSPHLGEFNEFVALAKKRGIRVVLVNMPVSRQFQGYWQSDEKVARYREIVERLATKKHLLFLDLYKAPPDLFPPESFWDTNHLSKVGAQILTKKLTESCLLPYFKSTMTPAAFYRAEFKDPVLPSHLTAGASAAGQITVKNTSSLAWPITGHSAVRISYHWLDEQGGMVLKDGQRSELEEQIPPGEERTLNFSFSMPPSAGNYALEVDLVYESSGWFGAKGNPALRVPVVIEKPERP